MLKVIQNWLIIINRGLDFLVVGCSYMIDYQTIVFILIVILIYHSHHIGGGTACPKLGEHEAEGGGRVGEEAAVAFAEVVEARLALGGVRDTVFGTLAVA